MVAYAAAASAAPQKSSSSAPIFQAGQVHALKFGFELHMMKSGKSMIVFGREKYRFSDFSGTPKVLDWGLKSAENTFFHCFSDF